MTTAHPNPGHGATDPVAELHDDPADLPPATSRGGVGAGVGAGEWIARSALLVVFAGMIVVFWALRPSSFATTGNVQAIVNQASVLAIFGIGVTVVLLSGEFDLAFPNIADTTTLIMGLLVTTAGFRSGPELVFAIVLGLAAALGFGLLSGAAIAFGKVPSFVATLAVGSLAAGFELGLQSKIGGGLKQISTLNLPTPLQDLGTYTVFGTGLRIGVFIALGIAALVWFILHRTVTGRRVQAVGANPEAAYLAAVPVARVRMTVFALAGALAGVAAVVAISQQGYFNGSSPPLLLQTYTVAFLGTAVLARRRFSILGTLVATLFLAVLANGLGLLNEPTWITSVVNGVVLLTAVMLTRKRGR